MDRIYADDMARQGLFGYNPYIPRIPFTRPTVMPVSSHRPNPQEPINFQNIGSALAMMRKDTDEEESPYAFGATPRYDPDAAMAMQIGPDVGVDLTGGAVVTPADLQFSGMDPRLVELMFARMGLFGGL
jgi:hypothetical protein